MKYNHSPPEDVCALDRVLWSQIRQGNRNAFARLYIQYRPYVLALCYGHAKDQETAEDMAQKIFLRLLENPPQHEILNTQAWLRQFCYNNWLNLFKKQQNRIQILEVLKRGFSRYAESYSTLDAMLIENLIRQLDEEDQRLLIYIIEGYKVREIARILGVDSKCISKRKYKVTKKFKEILRRHGLLD